jgi:hypothetical protein
MEQAGVGAALSSAGHPKDYDGTPLGARQITAPWPQPEPVDGKPAPLEPRLGRSPHHLQEACAKCATRTGRLPRGNPQSDWPLPKAFGRGQYRG